MQTLKKFIYLLTSSERKNACLLLIMILIMALLEMIGVASILPFMAVLTNPDIIETNIILRKMFQTSKIFGVNNNQEFLFALGILVFLVLITSLIFKSLTTYMQVRFIQMREYSISKRFIEYYLHQPYSWFLDRHSADLGKTILSEVGIIVARGMKPIIELIAKGMVTIVLIILLIVVDPKIALISSFTLVGAYALIYKLTLNYLNRIGKDRLKSNELRFTAVSEAFGAAKELKVGGLEQIFIERYSNPAKTYARSWASSQVITQLPRYALEAITFGGMILLVLYLMIDRGSFNSAIPIITLYIFAGYRLMPALQQIYSSFSLIGFVGPSIDRLYEEIINLKPIDLEQDKGVLTFNKKIVLKNICYNYPNTSRTALSDINLSITAKTTVGLVGTTGSGKTTTVDIILGLLEAQKGSLEIDDQIITKQNVRSWQRSIGYVPQHIYLADDTIEANIAFGINPKEINQESVKRASKIANLHEFVVNELPKEYQTRIGERGAKLSGGQRQRIGIARALYHNPKVLILDEATSALDNQTEKVVMEAISNLENDITIILIAHRLNTVKNCDIIFKLDSGQLVGQGTFDELIKN